MMDILHAAPEPSGEARAAVLSEIKDHCAIAGLLGAKDDIDSLVARLGASEEVLLEAEKDAFSQASQHLSARLSQAQAAREAFESELRTVEERSATVEASERAAGAVVRRVAGDHAVARTNLVVKRGTYAIRAVTEKARACSEARNAIAHGLVQEQTQLFEHQRKLFEIETERRQLNQEEYKRRVDWFQQQIVKTRERLDQAGERVQSLRALGVTRTTSGFLLWASYLSFGAFGWLFGETIQQAISSSQNAKGMLAYLAEAVKALADKYGPWQVVAALVLGPPVLCLAAFGFLYLWDFALGKFDTQWTEQRSSRRRRDTPITLWVGRAGPAVGRSHYTDLLASLPLLYLWGLVPLALAVTPAVIGTPGPASATNPWESLVYTYIGIVVVIVASALAMLYVAYVIEPRGRQTAQPLTLGQSWRRNIELVGLIAVCLAAFVVYPIVRMVYGALPSPWVGTHGLAASLLILLVALTAAYGIAFFGAYKDFERAQNELRLIEVELQEYAALPTIEMTGQGVKRFQRSLDGLYDDLDRLWKIPDWFTLLTGVPSREQSVWQFRRNATPTLTSFYTPEDVRFEPDAVARLGELDAALEVATREHQQLSEDLRALRAQHQSLKAAIQKSWQDEEAIATQGETRRREHFIRLESIRRNYAEIRAQAKSAFQIGAAVRGSNPAPATGGAQ